RISARQADVRFLIAAFNEKHRQYILTALAGSSVPVEVLSGQTPEIIRLASACMSVSGSVGLELLFASLPSVVVYQVSPSDMWWVRRFKTAKWISLVNLLAGEELLPEYLTPVCAAEQIANHICRWLTDSAARQELQDRLRELRERVGRPG